MLKVRQISPDRYRARQYLESMDDSQSPQQAEFTVARCGRRWYLSAGLSGALGGGFLILGFELTAQSELVLYGREQARIRQALELGAPAGKPIATA
ncbi:hypothetical protein [Azotobacter armeniacus]